MTEDLVRDSKNELADTTEDQDLVDRLMLWLRLRALRSDELEAYAEDPDVIRLMAHQRSFLM